MFVNKNDLNNNSNPIRNSFIHCQKSNHTTFNCFRKRREDGERKWNFAPFFRVYLPTSTLKHIRVKNIRPNTHLQTLQGFFLVFVLINVVDLILDKIAFRISLYSDPPVLPDQKIIPEQKEVIDINHMVINIMEKITADHDNVTIFAHCLLSLLMVTFINHHVKKIWFFF